MPLRRIPPQFIFYAVLLFAIVIILQVEVFRLVLSRLGLSPGSATLLLVTTFVGSAFNLPVGSVKSNFQFDESNPMHQLGKTINYRDGFTVIAINVGGGLVPVLFSVYLFSTMELNLVVVAVAVATVSAISYLFSRPIANLGIGMPLFIAPVSAAVIGMLLARESAPALAYIAGSLGVVIGADLLRIRDVRQLNAPIAAVGGAGTFDGIFITGIIAVLLTY